jgi:hypothetical protein
MNRPGLQPARRGGRSKSHVGLGLVARSSGESGPRASAGVRACSQPGHRMHDGSLASGPVAARCTPGAPMGPRGGAGQCGDRRGSPVKRGGGDGGSSVF